jgi:hypothetical protein
MAQAQLQEELIPAGGIADFVMSDAEIAALESEEATEQFGDSGIARFEPIAKRMASYGRYGDDQVIHAETGELLVPRALIEGNPELKESIFSHLREMGIEDPDRYVVGSSANSINPDTGMPEFFFKSIRRAVSKVAKGVSKAVSKVGKVLKKVAPVVLPIVLTPILGPVYAGAVGSGIGSLLNGGSLKDAVKAAALGGVTGAVFAGATGKGSFFDNIKAATADAGGRFSQLGSAIGKSASTGSFDPLMQSYQPTGSQIADDIAAGRADAGVSEAQELAKTRGTTTADVQAQAAKITGPSMDPNVARIDDPFFQDAAGNFDMNKYNQYLGETGRTQTLNTLPDGTRVVASDVPRSVTGGIDLDAANVQQNLMGTTSTGVTPPPPPAAPTETSFFDTLSEYGTKAKNLYGEYISPSRNALTDPQKLAEAQKLVDASKGQLSFDKAVDMVAANAPGMISSYAPLAAIGAAGAAAGGFFDAAPQEDPNLVDRRTGADLLAENENQYMVGGRTPQYATGPTTVSTRYGGLGAFAPRFFMNPFMRPQMFAAAGGEVYPRRNGGIMPNEGIPDQDSVRALLMPGEFVMTKDAVRGLGGGNLNQGINNMYSMMRNLETQGRVA